MASKKVTLRKHCIPCEGGVPPLSKKMAQELLPIVPGWVLQETKPLKLSRVFQFKDFVQAMKFVNGVAKIAEAEQHHPDIVIHWNRVTLTLFTHAISGLSENDFIMAKKINEI